MAKEARARILINALLERAGWRFFDNARGPANVQVETHSKSKKKFLDQLGDNFEGTEKGFIDYLLLDPAGKPAAVLEAKSENKDPLVGKEQARRYARAQKARFVILSNGNLHYFWDTEQGNPEVITEFPTPDSLGFREKFQPDPQALIKEVVERDYIALTQNPKYQDDPRWNEPAQRDTYLKDANLKLLRPYQLRAIKRLQKAVATGCSRFLFEMATGTGKTLTAAAVIKLFLSTKNATRVLFLVDRLELENQAYKNFVRYLKNDYSTVIYKENRDDWRKAEIVVSTVQSLLFGDKYRRLFSPTDFDFIISDEAHRSIGGNSRAVFEYFIGYKLGLTATPRDYLRKLDPKKISDRDPREWERRQLLDTYKTFGCDRGTPTYRYSLLDGVKEGFLLNPVVVDARTKITTQMLSDKGYAVIQEDEDGEPEEVFYGAKDFEKNFFSDNTNRVFCETLLKHALRDRISREIGKSIVFCVSRRHASKITQTLNELAHKAFPGKYHSDFAVQVTSDIPDAQQMAISFANNNLNGHTRVLEGYISSKTRICVTVGMMTTGYDCEDLLNIVLLRPIFSPTDFIQIKGRGTRKYTFSYQAKSGAQKTDREKEKFKLFDFFANCEYFEEKFNYDEVLHLPAPRKGSPAPGPMPPAPAPAGYTNVDQDPLQSLIEEPVPLQGMKIDRKFFEDFELKLSSNAKLRKLYQTGMIKDAEEFARDHLLNDDVTLDKLRTSLQLDRRVTLREILAKAFGDLDRFKSREELVEEEVAKFVSIHKPDAREMPAIRKFFTAYLTDPYLRHAVDTRQFAQLADNPRVSLADLKALGKWRDLIPEYVKDYVHLNTYA